jgi:hypothetical protein
LFWTSADLENKLPDLRTSKMCASCDMQVSVGKNSE